MYDLNSISNEDINKMLDSAPDIWSRLKMSLARQIAEHLILELNGVPSNSAKLVSESVSNIPILRKAA